MASAFENAKKGEFFELKAELNSQSNSMRKEAVRKTIAAMTVGRDVSSLFMDVLNCMQSQNIEIKKLVYLYIVNYAQTKPDLAILAVNSFVKDSGDPNPLLRALAIRTMACIRVEKIIEYLLDPLQRALRDSDPYVRKTAAVCVAKLFAMNPDLVEEQGMLESLFNLLTDGNAMVVSNAVAALMDIRDIRPEVLVLDSQLVMKLLHALNECNEWGQVFILDALVGYDIPSHEEADGMVERVTARLQHANGAVVMSAVKLIVANADKMSTSEKAQAALNKLKAPLVTLLTSGPEMQFVALRSIRVIIQKYPSLLNSDVRMFFCQYNDPLYVKQEKLEVMCALVDGANFANVVQELRDYALEVDPEFVRKAVECIGRVAVNLEPAADKCLDVLASLAPAQNGPVVEETVIAMKDILRSYPGRYDSFVEKLCERADTLQEPEARAALIWMVGEYIGKLSNARNILEEQMEAFEDEPIDVQLQLLTATVKGYLVREAEFKDLAERALSLSMGDSFNMDLRDRGFAYHRLLSAGLDVARTVVIADKPAIADGRRNVAPKVLEDISRNVGNVSALLLRHSSEFGTPQAPPMVLAGRGSALKGMTEDLLIMDDDGSGVANGGQLDQPANGAGDAFGLDSLMGALPAPPAAQSSSMQNSGAQSLLDDLFGARPAALPPTTASQTLPAPQQSSSTQSTTSNPDDILAALGVPSQAGTAPQSRAPPPAAAAAAAQQPMQQTRAAVPVKRGHGGLPLLLSAEKGKGLQVSGTVRAIEEDLYFELAVENKLTTALTGFAIQFNKNAFGIAPATPLRVSEPLQPGSSDTILLQMKKGVAVDLSKGAVLQLAVKCNPLGVLYMMSTFTSNLDAVFDRTNDVTSGTFPTAWNEALAKEEVSTTFSASTTSPDALAAKLISAKFVSAGRTSPSPGTEILQFCASLSGSGIRFLCVLAFDRSSGNVAAKIRPSTSISQSLVTAFVSTMERLIVRSN